MLTCFNSVTAGVGSDHVDLNAAAEKGIQVLEVSGSNVTSVAEHVVMSILLLVRNFVPAHEMIERGDWQVSEIGGCQPLSFSYARS
jgi:formate dehydrogenase